jgi:Ran GTPase-activating protein (RanGAP) involved in mRNA processing and transport
MMYRWVFRRGFVEEFTVEARGLLLQAEAVFTLAPLRALEVYLARHRIEALASLPQLARLTALRLGSNSLGNEGARALASSPHLHQLGSLDLRYNDIEAGGIEALAASPSLLQLVRLNVTGNHIGDAGALALARGFPNLRSLEAYWNSIEDEGRRALVDRFGDRVLLEERRP